MSFAAALDALEEGVPPNIVQVTIPEGLSRREIADVVGGRPARQLPGGQPALAGCSIRATTARRARTSLEGFLFPATYELRRGVPVRRLVERQLDRVQGALRRPWTCATPAART